VTWGFVRLLTPCLHNTIVATATVAAAVMRQRYRPVSHKLNMIGFVRLSVRLSHRLYKWKPITSTSGMTWHLECERDFEVSRNCRTTALFYGKRTTKNRPTEGKDRGTPNAAMHRLHICCTTRANCSFAIRGNAEFFGCGMRKSDKG